MLNITHEHNHIFCTIDGHRLLIDTGAPMSFGRCDIEWRGQPYDLRGGLAMVDLDDLGELLGLPVDGLIGADLLLDNTMLLDINRGVIEWPSAESPAAVGIPMAQISRVPVAKVPTPDGGIIQCAVDTGASQTFVCAEYAGDTQPIGTIDDFYPGLGPFEAQLIPLRCAVGGDTHEIEAAVLPEALGGLMTMFGIEGIIGLDLLAMQAATFDVASNTFAPHIAVLGVSETPRSRSNA